MCKAHLLLLLYPIDIPNSLIWHGLTCICSTAVASKLGSAFPQNSRNRREVTIDLLKGGMILPGQILNPHQKTRICFIKPFSWCLERVQVSDPYSNIGSMRDLKTFNLRLIVRFEDQIEWSLLQAAQARPLRTSKSFWEEDMNEPRYW